jgi:hypothetical protein
MGGMWMPHVTIEYMIMMPVMILQVFLFPLVAGWLMNYWVDSRRTLALQDVTSHLGSTVQQLYFSLNHETIPSGTVTYYPGLPPFIENFYYVGNATLLTGPSSESNSSTYLELTMKLAGTSYLMTTTVVLGANVLWQQSTFMSNSTHACVSAQKFPNGTISLWFGE